MDSVNRPLHRFSDFESFSNFLQAKMRPKKFKRAGHDILHIVSLTSLIQAVRFYSLKSEAHNKV